MTYFVTAICSACLYVRTGLTSADLQSLGWKRSENGKSSCPRCVKRQERSA